MDPSNPSPEGSIYTRFPASAPLKNLNLLINFLGFLITPSIATASISHLPLLCLAYLLQGIDLVGVAKVDQVDLAERSTAYFGTGYVLSPDFALPELHF